MDNNEGNIAFGSREESNSSYSPFKSPRKDGSNPMNENKTPTSTPIRTPRLSSRSRSRTKTKLSVEQKMRLLNRLQEGQNDMDGDLAFNSRKFSSFMSMTDDSESNIFGSPFVDAMKKQLDGVEEEVRHERRRSVPDDSNDHVFQPPLADSSSSFISPALIRSNSAYRNSSRLSSDLSHERSSSMEISHEKIRRLRNTENPFDENSSLKTVKYPEIHMNKSKNSVNTKLQETAILPSISNKYIESQQEKQKRQNPIGLQKSSSSQQRERTPTSSPKKQTVIATPSRHERQAVSFTPHQRIEKRPTKGSSALDNFQFHELIGTGAFARVYRGVNLRTGRTVAIKQIELDINDADQLTSEIDLLKILKHPNIVKYHGFVKTRSHLNIFLEYCGGGSLRAMYKSLGKGMSEDKVISFVRQILQGLSYLHEQGVVHRDVKAANVLLTKNGDVKLADFGVASKVSSRETMTAGTPNWMAPESVLGGEGISTASDIWSLGATIIELLTTYPPYHKLNPMAALHAIGTDLHPPLPPNISPQGKEFLMECFQKQPSLRSGAKRLLQHKWLNLMTKPSVLQPSSHLNIIKKQLKVLGSTALPNESSFNISSSLLDYSDWSPVGDGVKVISPSSPESMFNQDMILASINDELNKHERLAGACISEESRTAILHKHSENQENYSDLEQPIKLMVNGPSSREFNSDIVIDLEIQYIVDNEKLIEEELKPLLEEFSGNVNDLHRISHDLISCLVDNSQSLLDYMETNVLTGEVFLRDHGLVSMLELLEYSNQFPDLNDLWYNSLRILNLLFQLDISILENFAVLGGVPLFIRFGKISFKKEIRLEVVKFIEIALTSDSALSIFVSCGGLRLLAKLIEEDLEYSSEFPLASVNAFHSILNKDLINSKSDICRIISKYGVSIWLVIVLNDLMNWNEVEVKKHKVDVNAQAKKILEILAFFANSEARVRANIATADFFRLILKVYPKLSFSYQVAMLKVMRSLSNVSSALQNLYAANVLEFLINILDHFRSTSEARNISNIVCPILYNMCYLNPSREVEIVKFGGIPLLINLTNSKYPSRQFIIPILCELISCDRFVRQTLWESGLFGTLVGLLQDPYWQSNALESIMKWYQQEPDLLDEEMSSNLASFIEGFITPRGSNLEFFLENFVRLSMHCKFSERMFNESLLDDIFKKLQTYQRNSVMELGLLRVLKNLILAQDGSDELKLYSGRIKESLHGMFEDETSMLVNELTREIAALVEGRRDSLNIGSVFYSPSKREQSRLSLILDKS